MEPMTLEEWIQSFERKLEEQERRIREMEARMKELEEKVRILSAEIYHYKQRVALMERILMEKGLLSPELTTYARWLGTLH